MDSNPQPGRCRTCMDRMFCCKSSNNIETNPNDDKSKCCGCIPWRKKTQQADVAWAERRASTVDVPQKPP